MNILIVDTNNLNRSFYLEQYLKEKYPSHSYLSAGVNKCYVRKMGRHYLTQDDINWSNLVVCAEEVHKTITEIKIGTLNKEVILLGCGEYKNGSMDMGYISKAENKLITFLL